MCQFKSNARRTTPSGTSLGTYTSRELFTVRANPDLFAHAI